MAAITPTGDPAWVRNASIATYGGDTEKENYMGKGSVNGKTDVSAQESSRMVADLLACVRTASFATITYTQDDTGMNDPTVDEYEGMAGAAPTLTRQGDGDVKIIWPTSVDDPYSRPGSIHIGHCEPSVGGATSADANWELLDDNSDGLNEGVRIRCFDAAGVAVKDKTVTVSVTTSPP